MRKFSTDMKTFDPRKASGNSSEDAEGQLKQQKKAFESFRHLKNAKFCCSLNNTFVPKKMKKLTFGLDAETNLLLIGPFTSKFSFNPQPSIQVCISASAQVVGFVALKTKNEKKCLSHDEDIHSKDRKSFCVLRTTRGGRNGTDLLRCLQR